MIRVLDKGSLAGSVPLYLQPCRPDCGGAFVGGWNYRNCPQRPATAEATPANKPVALWTGGWLRLTESTGWKRRKSLRSSYKQERNLLFEKSRGIRSSESPEHEPREATGNEKPIQFPFKILQILTGRVWTWHVRAGYLFESHCFPPLT